MWLINGLFCKVLNLTPRHQDIVAEITHFEFSKELTITIGILEILMSLWILSKIKPKLNAIMQIIIIAVMNILEYILVPQLLLWGRFNIIFALLLIIAIYVETFHLNKLSQTKSYAFKS
ncbi:hypothetical protein GCM10011368_34160 [Hyunsoonleella pacifica]|nr:hypothetical protein GCM10011368_34160 [Hyunsoonleella pacifica]